MGGSAGFERKFVPNSAREVQMPGSERENSLFYARKFFVARLARKNGRNPARSGSGEGLGASEEGE